VQKLRNSMREYENDRWRIISTKVGSGFSPAACKEKATELESGEIVEGDDNPTEEESSFDHSHTEQPGSASSEAPPAYH
jgi:hypothetical protein